MKKTICILTSLLLAAATVFAVSYTNNTYQMLAQEYTVKAQKALDAGHFDLAEEYAVEAEKNAALSDAFIKSMMARSEADNAIAQAQERIDYAKSINADRDFPIAYEAALGYMNQAQEAYTAEEFEKAVAAAQQVMVALAEIHEVIPLPKFYIVRPWAETRDCFWNISGRPYVYNNPFLWENLYEANKDNIPERNNPNLILPGMKMEIPSITGEYRDGVYSPDVNYEAFSANR